MENEYRHMKNMKRLLAVVAGAALICYGCSKITSDYRADHGVPPCEYTAPLDSLFTPLFGDDEPGAIVMVMRNDTIIYDHAYGMVRLDSAERITDSTMFNIASASKAFSAVAIMKLQEQGLLKLDDPLTKFFPEFKAPFYKEISIRDVLTHSTGLPDLRPLNMNEWKKYIGRHHSVFGTGRDYRLYGGENEHMKVFRDLDTLSYRTGTRTLHDDPAFILIVPLVERLTGKDFDIWMDDNLFEPAGMTDTYYRNAGVPLPRTCHAYRRPQNDARPNVFRTADGKWEEYDYGEAEFFLTKADRGAYSSGRDFMRWNKALYGGKIISQASLDSINTPRVPTEVEGVNYGYANVVRNVDGLKKVYHINDNGGYSVVEAAFPEKNLFYIILANRADWDRSKITAQVDSILLR